MYEYIKSNRSPEERITPGGHLDYYKIPVEVPSRPYIFVSARWNVPPRVVNGEIVMIDYDKPPDAKWMFYISDKRD